MPSPLRLDRDALRTTYGVSARLAARLGALMTRNIGISEVVAEAASPGSLLERLLLERDLLQADDVATTLSGLLSSTSFADVSDDFALVIAQDDDWLVIATEEECLADEGFRSAADRPAPMVPAKPPVLPAASGPTAPDAEITPDTYEQTRLRIFVGSSGAEKVAALREYLHLPLPVEEKRRVSLQAVADPDAALRSAAARGLQALGLEPEVADAAALLVEGDAEERGAAGERLHDLAATSSELARDVILITLIGILRDLEIETDRTVQALGVLERSIPSLGASRSASDELMRVLLDRLLGADEPILEALQDVLRAIYGLRPEAIRERLYEEVRRSRSARFRGLLFRILADLPIPQEQRASLISTAAEALPELQPDSESCRSTMRFLLSAGDDGVAALATVASGAQTGLQRALVRVLDNALRSQPVGPAATEATARAALEILRHGEKQVRIDLLETRVGAHAALPAELRTALAEAFLRDLRDFAQWPLSESLEDTLERLGAPAAGPLLTALQEHRQSPQSAVVASALGRLGAVEAARGGDGTQVAETILRELQRIGFGEVACRDAIHLALGRICAAPAISPHAAGLIVRTLMQRLDGSSADGALLEALGASCRGPGPSEAEIQQIAWIALERLQAPPPEPEVAVRPSEPGEPETFVFGRGIDVYADLIPRCLQALVSIMQSERTPPPVRETLLQSLTRLWQQGPTIRLQWGPANAQRLTEALGRIGVSNQITLEQRTVLARTLASRTGDVTTLEALIAVLGCGDEQEVLDRIAGAVALKLLRQLEENRELTLEEREARLRLLTRLGIRGRLAARGVSEERLMQRLLVVLLAGLRHAVPGTLKQLVQLRDAQTLPAPLQARLDEEIHRFTTLAPRS